MNEEQFDVLQIIDQMRTIFKQVKVSFPICQLNNNCNVHSPFSL